jgi:hypothetical protein
MTKFLKILLLLLLCASAWLHPALAQKAASEYEVKAAFLYNFIKFVEWPQKAFADKNAPYVIGILGNSDPFFDDKALINYLDQSVNGKSINERGLMVRRAERLLGLKDCHLIFVSKSERNRVRDILNGLRGSHVLTVSEVDGFCEQGGMINFTKQGDKVRFEINPAAAEAAGLKISSKLLNVAKIVSTQAR